MPSAVRTERFDEAIALIDEANAADPNTVTVRGRSGPKELLHAYLITEWVQRLAPDASQQLLLAARAHHIRRWEIPRDSYPPGRSGYLRWRRDLHTLHAQHAALALGEAGYDDETVQQVEQIIRKYRLGKDPEVQVLEDALCLVFLETQLDDTAAKLGDEAKTLEVLRKTWRKMSAAGRELALQLPLSDRGHGLVETAIAAD